MPELCETETFQSEPALQNYHNRLQPMKEGVGNCEAGKKRADILKVRLGDGCGRTRTLVTCNDCTLSIQHASSLRESSWTKNLTA